MMKPFALLAFPLLAGAVLSVPSPASADTSGCVTRAEYQKVHKGDSKAHVAQVFDTAGHRESIAHSGGYTAEIRSYRTCSPYSAVAIAYGNGQLDVKSAVWVH